MSAQTDWIVGLCFIGAAIVIMIRAFSLPPQIIGRNAAMKRMLERPRE